jgi:hypothetical protein
MLTTPNGEGNHSSLARWDYRPHEVRAAANSASDGKIRFQLELPPETPAREATQLWVRLLPRRGEKLLAHAEIKLHEPSMFSSKPERASDAPPAQRGPADISLAAAAPDNTFNGVAPVNEESQPKSQSAGSAIFDGGWTIARPGHPAGLTTDGEDTTNAWRASLEPPLSVIADGEAARPKPRVIRPRESTESGNADMIKTRKPKMWSPERSASSAARDSRTASRPAWSASR